jgi:hypothetical protein
MAMAATIIICNIPVVKPTSAKFSNNSMITFSQDMVHNVR